MGFLDNLDMRDEEVAEEEVAHFARSGGRTLVELTTIGLSPDLTVLARVSKATGVNIIAGTGYYIAATHPPMLDRMTVDEIASEMVRAIRDGDPISRIRAGIIGEIGTSDPIQATELNVVRAAGRAHLETGCPISFHFAPGLREVFRVFNALEREGVASLGKVVVGHADDVLDLPLHKEIAAAGAMVEYDTFGNEEYTSPFGRRMPSDRERVAAAAEFVDAGLVDQLLVSQDVCMKSLWKRFGGHGYANLLDRVAPMLAAAGLSDNQRATIFVTNPGRMLAFMDS